ncbi:MAG: acyltransferase [Alistipes sp.]
MEQKQDQYIEALRGATILLVVTSHVIGIDSCGGMQVADNSGWRYIYSTLCANYITMPIFAAIAGWIYALHPLQQPIHTFLYKKVKRLLFPLLFTGTLYFLIQYFTANTNQTTALSDIWQIYLFPYTIFWFLPALFLIFCYIAVVDKFQVCKSLKCWVAGLLISIAFSVFAHIAAKDIPNYFCIWGAMRLLPFFFLGLGLQRFKAQLSSFKLRRLYLIGFFGTAVLFQLLWFTFGSTHILRQYSLTLPLSFLTIAFLLTVKRRPAPPWLVFFGQSAYGIYLFHAFGTAAGRISMNALGIQSELPIFCIALILGIGVPLLIEKVLHRMPLLSLLFLGQTHAPQRLKLPSKK